MSKLDPMRGGRNVAQQHKYRQKFVDGGKICSKCDKVQPLDLYNKRQGGLQSTCKICMNEKNRKRWEKQKHPLW